MVTTTGNNDLKQMMTMAQSLSSKAYPPKGGNSLPKYMGCDFAFNKYKNKKRKYKHKKKDSYSTYSHLTQLGVEYSSNNAGDGPVRLIDNPIDDFVDMPELSYGGNILEYLEDFYDEIDFDSISIHFMRVSLLKQEINLVYKFPETPKLSYYIVMRNITYDGIVKRTYTNDKFVKITQDFQKHLEKIAFFHVDLQRSLKRYSAWQVLIQERNNRIRKQYKAFLNPDMSVQLGVAYSSNDAGDGPVMYVLVLLFATIPLMNFGMYASNFTEILGFAYMIRDLEVIKNFKITKNYKKPRMDLYTGKEYLYFLVKLELIMCIFIEICMYALSAEGQQGLLELIFFFRMIFIMYGRQVMYKLLIGKFKNFHTQATRARVVRNIKRKARDEEIRNMSKEDKKYEKSEFQMFSAINSMSDRDRKFYEALIWYAASLKRCKTITDVFFASSGFYQMISEQSIYSQIANSDFVDYFVNLFGEEPLDMQGNPQTQSYEELKNFRLFLGNYDKIKESEVYCKIKRFIIYTLCKISHLDLGINFQSCGYTKLEEVAMRRKYSSNLILSILC